MGQPQIEYLKSIAGQGGVYPIDESAGAVTLADIQAKFPKITKVKGILAASTATIAVLEEGSGDNVLATYLADASNILEAGVPMYSLNGGFTRVQVTASDPGYLFLLLDD